MEAEIEPKEQEQTRFAKLIADRLGRGRVDNHFESPRSGRDALRFSVNCARTLVHPLEIGKDYPVLRPEALRARLPERL